MKLSKLFGLALLLAVLGFTGCGGSSDSGAGKKGEDPKTKKEVKKEEKDEHDHGDGPHGGTIIEFGKYHAEFCMDHGKKQATIYILSGNLKKAVPLSVEKLTLSIKSPQFQVEVKPSPLEGEPKGQSSRFIAVHENFAKEQEFEGTLSGEVEGKPVQGDFKEHPPEEHTKEKDKK